MVLTASRLIILSTPYEHSLRPSSVQALRKGRLLSAGCIERPFGAVGRKPLNGDFSTTQRVSTTDRITSFLCVAQGNPGELQRSAEGPARKVQIKPSHDDDGALQGEGSSRKGHEVFAAEELRVGSMGDEWPIERRYLMLKVHLSFVNCVECVRLRRDISHKVIRA